MKTTVFLWIAVSLLLSNCGNSPNASQENQSNDKVVALQKIEPIDQNVALNFDSLRGNVQSIVYQYFLVNDSAIFLQKDSTELLWVNEDFYDKNGKLTRHTGPGFIDQKYTYNDKGMLIEIHQDGDFDYRYIAFKTVYKHNKSGALVEEIEYVRHDTQEDDSKVILGKFTETEKIDYQYNADGTLAVKIFYKAENGKFVESYREKKIDTKEANPGLSYNAQGEFLFSDHSFRCQIDDHGNWITKIDSTDIGGVDAFVFIERKIIYY